MWRVGALLILFVSRVYMIKANQDWDYVVFTQTWPATFCKLLEARNSTDRCVLRDELNTWVIHGIWPSSTGGMGPEFCNDTWLFQTEEVKSIVPDLEQRWLNIIAETPVNFLWTHEWQKHGTCAAELESLNSQMKYFYTGLKWFQNFTMAKILSEANIVPSDSETYSPTVIYHAIKNKIGVTPEIKCKKVEDRDNLFEIRICFSRDLEIENCRYKAWKYPGMYNDDLDFITNCNSESIFYPKERK